jgi:hypothetical protein
VWSFSRIKHRHTCSHTSKKQASVSQRFGPQFPSAVRRTVVQKSWWRWCKLSSLPHCHHRLCAIVYLRHAWKWSSPPCYCLCACYALLVILQGAFSSYKMSSFPSNQHGVSHQRVGYILWHPWAMLSSASASVHSMCSCDKGVTHQCVSQKESPLSGNARLQWFSHFCPFRLKTHEELHTIRHTIASRNPVLPTLQCLYMTGHCWMTAFALHQVLLHNLLCKA